MSSLTQFVTLAAYQSQRAEFFPSVESLRWAVRQHRAELATAGAMIKVADRIRLQPDLADQVFIEAGRRSVQGA